MNGPPSSKCRLCEKADETRQRGLGVMPLLFAFLNWIDWAGIGFVLLMTLLAVLVWMWWHDGHFF